MPTVIVLTDFSDSSRNALQYACSFLPVDTDLLLLHVYPTPFSYSADGVAFTSLGEALSKNQEDLENELEWANEHFPGYSIHYKEIMGEYITVLKEQCQDEKAILVIMGTPANHGETALWETNTLSVLTELQVPVLTIPQEAGFRPIKNIGFACKPENIKDFTPIGAIEKLVQFTNAKLHVVRVITPGSEALSVADGEQLLREKLGMVDADYYTMEGTDIISNISLFIQEHQLDLLLIRPKKHGVWYKAFHENYARKLAALDMIPVMALHEGGNGPEFPA